MNLLHLGPAHEVEQWLTLVLALGPFVALAIVVLLRRGEDDEDVVEPDGTPQER